MKKRNNIIVAIVLLVATVATAFFAYSLRRENYYGASYFTDGSYLEFRGGDLFKEFIEEYAPSENYTVTNFLYINRNPLHRAAKHKRDVFVLEISCSEQEYFQAQAYASANSNYESDVVGDFEVIHPHRVSRTTCPQIGFHEATYTIRYVLYTNVPHLGVIRDYGLNWIAGESLLTYTLDPDDPKTHIR